MKMKAYASFDAYLKDQSSKNVYSDTGLVQFGFFAGASLKDPKGLLEGKGQYVRHTKVRAPSEIDERAFAALLKQAASR
jgi:hypothetical protein